MKTEEKSKVQDNSRRRSAHRRYGRPVNRPLNHISAAIAIAVSAAAGGVRAASPLVPTAVVHGSAAIATRGAVTTITAANRTIIDYSRFNIPAGNTVRFVQPDATATVLNRINSATPSQIDGNLLGNGIVYLANPAGVLFGPHSVVNVGQLFAAASHISNHDFLSGINHFTGSRGVVDNQGTILASAVNLIGRQVSNEGTIMAPKGMVALAAGNDVYLGRQNGNVYVELQDAPATTASQKSGVGASNTGTIDAAGGSVNLTAGDVFSIAARQSGTIKAASITVQGGAKSTVLVSGKLDADNQAPNQTGGTVNIGGGQIGIGVNQDASGNFTTPGVSIDADGTNGGGKILIGVKPDSSSPTGYSDAANCDYVSNNSSLSADATVKGNGGLIDTSGANLQVNPGATITATGSGGGTDGMWLLDPVDVDIVEQLPPATFLGLVNPTTLPGPTPGTESGGPPLATYAPSDGFGGIGATTSPAYITAGTITGEIDQGTSVEVASEPSGLVTDVVNLAYEPAGNITVEAPIKITYAGGHTPGSSALAPTLTLSAFGSVTIEPTAGISSTNGPLNLDVAAGQTGSSGSTASITTLAPISTDGGNVAISCSPTNLGQALNPQQAVITIGSEIDTQGSNGASGNVAIVSQLSPLALAIGYASGVSSVNINAPILTMSPTYTQTGSGGYVDIQSYVNAASDQMPTVLEANSSVYLNADITTAGGAVKIVSQAQAEPASGYSAASSAVVQAAGSLISAGAGAVTIDSQSGETGVPQSAEWQWSSNVQQFFYSWLPIPMVGKLATLAYQSSVSGVSLQGQIVSSGAPVSVSSYASLDHVGPNGACISAVNCGGGEFLASGHVSVTSESDSVAGPDLMNPAIELAGESLGLLDSALSSAGAAAGTDVGQTAAEDFLTEELSKIASGLGAEASATALLNNSGIGTCSLLAAHGSAALSGPDGSLSLGCDSTASTDPISIIEVDGTEEAQSASLAATDAPSGDSLGSSGIYFAAGSRVATSGGGQIYGGPVLISGGTSLSDGGSGAINFNGAVDGTPGTNSSLSISTGGDVYFGGPVGATTPLGSLSISNAAAIDVAGSTIDAGTTSFDVAPTYNYTGSVPSGGGGAATADLSYLQEYSNAGASATIDYSSLGYDLFSTSPVGDDSQNFVGTNGAFLAGTQILSLPNFISSITAPGGQETISSAGFLYSTLDNPASPGQQVQAGLEGVHAPGPDSSVPILDVNLSPTASVPSSFDIGFLTNVHLDRPDDYPATITMSDGTASATVNTGQGNGSPNGGVDVYEFQVSGAKPGDQIVISASQDIQNYTGGQYNPSVSAILFAPGSLGEQPPTGGSTPPTVSFITPPAIQAPPTIIPPPGNNTSPAPVINIGKPLTSIDNAGSQVSSGNNGGASKSDSGSSNSMSTAGSNPVASIPSSVFPLPVRTPSSSSTATGDPFAMLLFNAKPSATPARSATSPFTTSSIVTNGSETWTAPTQTVTKTTKTTGNSGGIVSAVSNFLGSAASAIGNFFGSIF